MRRKLPPIFRNFFFVVALVYVVWMLFFDINDVFTQWENRRKVEELKDQREFYLNNIKQVKEDIHSLRSDDRHLEKFAREHYKMHKVEEDVYEVVVEEPKE